MGTAETRGALRGAAMQDYEITEGMFLPLYDRVFTEAGVAAGTIVLDVGCGPGLAAHLAAKRGALVSGLDAAKSSVSIAQARTANGDFRVGEMESLPWFDNTFDVVTGFNSFQSAANTVNALREARRVARPRGRVAVTVWGPEEKCETSATTAAILKFLPHRPQTPEHPVPLSTPRRLEELMVEAGLEPLKSGEITCSFLFPNLDTAVRGLMSTGGAVAAAKRIGSEPVRRAVTESLAPFRTPSGTYRQRNTFRYVIASPLAGSSEVD